MFLGGLTRGRSRKIGGKCAGREVRRGILGKREYTKQKNQ